MRIALFTDTLADVNGVSRFIRNLAEQALASDRDLTVITSTRLALAPAPGAHNLRPLFARSMPGYPQLEVAWPPRTQAKRLLHSLAPDAVHISTPGPIGLLGRRLARGLQLPILGTYHTDFPAYIDHLFDDRCLTWATRAVMRRFYRPFAGVLTRSGAYADSVADLGVRRDRIVPLRAGIDTTLFSAPRRNASVWERLGVPASDVKVLSVGRVSVEKNLPLLARAWPSIRAACLRAGAGAALVVVGDGPYRADMERLLGPSSNAHFLGFRHGEELATLYASADLFVFPSATDTLGQVVMEAQACGLPAVVSDRGGPRESIVDGVTGLVAPAFEANAWIRAITRLACDDDLRSQMGVAARERMKHRTIASSFEHFWELHERAAAGLPLDRPPTPAPRPEPAAAMVL